MRVSGRSILGLDSYKAAVVVEATRWLSDRMYTPEAPSKVCRLQIGCVQVNNTSALLCLCKGIHKHIIQSVALFLGLWTLPRFSEGIWLRTLSSKING